MLEFAFATYEVFGLDVRLELSTRPEQRIGSDELWDHSEAALRRRSRPRACRYDAQRGRRRLLRPQDRHAHDRLAGPLVAARHRASSTTTCPARFEPHLHRRRQRRAPAGDDPPRADGLLRAVHRDPARALRAASCRCGWRRCRRSCCRSPTATTSTAPASATRLRGAGLRAELDDRTESVARKIRDAELRKIPFMLVVGDREAEARRGQRPRAPGGDTGRGRRSSDSPSACSDAGRNLARAGDPSLYSSSLIQLHHTRPGAA